MTKIFKKTKKYSKINHIKCKDNFVKKERKNIMLANLNDVLKPAEKNHYAVGLFNTCSLEFARGVIAAAEETSSPVIIGTAEILLPSASLQEMADMLLPMARRASVPVVVHLDHGLTESCCKEALDLGFSSIMYDCSTDPYEENVRKVREMTELAHSRGATIEAELGHVGNTPSANGGAVDPSAFYTEPEQAKDFVARTGVDALAIAVGTAHGAYRLPPKLDFQRIRDIAGVVDASLVLHGGSGLTDDDFRNAIDAGISKINIFTDLNLAGAKAAHDYYETGETLLTDLQPRMVEAIRQATVRKMTVFRNR